MSKFKPPLRFRQADLSDIADALASLVGEVQDNGSTLRSRCPNPAHPGDGDGLSLSVFPNGDGFIHFKCHSHGCDPQTLEEVVRRELRELPAGDRPARVVPEPQPLPEQRDWDSWRAALSTETSALLRALRATGWDGHQAALVELGIGWTGSAFAIPGERNVVFYNPTAARAGKIRALRGRPRELLFNAAARSAPRVFVFEGEGDWITACLAGLPSISVPGATGWKDAFAEALSGREVVVCMDCDEAGRRAAVEIRESLIKHEISACIIDLDPARTDGYDFKAHAHVKGLEAAASDVRSRADAVPSAATHSAVAPGTHPKLDD